MADLTILVVGGLIVDHENC